MQRQLNKQDSPKNLPAFESKDAIQKVSKFQQQHSAFMTHITKIEHSEKDQLLRECLISKYLSLYLQNKNQSLNSCQRLQFLSKALDTLLKIWENDQYHHEDIQNQIRKWLPVLGEVDGFFFDKYLNQEPTANSKSSLEIYKQHWMRFLQFLSEEIIQQHKTISNIFFNRKLGYIKPTLNKICEDIRIANKHLNSDDQSVYSDTSFNPVLYKAKKQKKYHLAYLLSEESIQQMKMRIKTIQNQELRNKLISNLQQVFHSQQQGNYDIELMEQIRNQ